MGSDRDHFQGLVGFDSVCFGEVHAKVAKRTDYLGAGLLLLLNRKKPKDWFWERASDEMVVVCLPPFWSCVFVGDRGVSCSFRRGFVCASVYVNVCPVSVFARMYSGCLCEIQRCTVILLFTVSIRLNFLYRLFCSARLPSHSPSSTTPSSAFTAINLGCEVAYGSGTRERGSSNQP